MTPTRSGEYEPDAVIPRTAWRAIAETINTKTAVTLNAGPEETAAAYWAKIVQQYGYAVRRGIRMIDGYAAYLVHVSVFEDSPIPHEPNIVATWINPKDAIAKVDARGAGV